RSQRGFSLLELMAVIALIFIMAAGAVIGVSNVLPSVRATSGMNQVIMQLRQARQAAISDRRTTIVNFTGNNKIQILQTPPGGGVAVPLIPPVPIEGGVQFVYFPALGDTPMNFGTCPSATCFTNPANPGAGIPATSFLADGSFGAGIGVPINGTIFLGIPGKSSTARAVTILGATGRIRSYYWTGTSWQE